MLARHFVFISLMGLTASVCVAAEEDLETTFRDSVQPMLQSNCLACHNRELAEADLDLSADVGMSDVVNNFRHWANVLDRLKSGDMPPENAAHFPTTTERNAVIRWIELVKDAEAKRTAGDPGMVLAHRLNSSQYNYTIRDLAGVDIRPAAAFPVDPANEAGFDNSGESLAMSPALLIKYLEAATKVSRHLVLTPSGLEFAPHPVMTDTDRDKYCVNRIIDFYQRQKTDYADYFILLWHFQNQLGDGDRHLTLVDMARRQQLSVRYCQSLWNLLQEDRPNDSCGPIAVLRHLFSELPDATQANADDVAIAGCQQIASFISQLRTSLVPEVPNLTAPGMNDGSQSLVLWKNQQFVANRQRYVEGTFEVGNFGLPAASEAARLMHPTNDVERAELTASLTRFCSLFPDQFFVSERARVYLDQDDEKSRTGRFLSAGFHSQMGYFRDDAPLYELMLDDAERDQIDRLWLELDFVTSAPMRQYAGFIWFDRTDSQFMRDRVFDRYRAEDKDCIAAEKVAGLAEAYRDKAKRLGASDEAIHAVESYFTDMSQTFRRLETLSVLAEPKQLDAVIEFAERANRRPLSDMEIESVRSFYDSMRDDERLSHEDAIRDSVIRILMSPRFCYRIDAPQEIQLGDDAIVPLDDYAIASRLSYFLWSSMPDAELIELAKQGQLHLPSVIKAQTRRMLNNDRVSGLLTEFTGNWLDFRRFEEHNGVDRDRFPEFTDQLRQSMAAEPILFFADLIENDGSILDFLYANHTFVNRSLAKHYGMDDAYAAEPRFQQSGDEWWRVEPAEPYGRGGLLPMAVFLTNNSPGLRTSPVKRGNWLIKRILGEQVPAPPASVPDLPSDESKLGDLTLREALQQHRENIACAGCHNRIDSMGLVFEGYGPVGEIRVKDLGGRTVDDSAVFPNGTQGSGLEGLRDYIRLRRQDDFVDNLCRKLLAFGLGRTLQLSDESTIATMKSSLVKNDYRFRSMVDVIVTSPSFLNKRVQHSFEQTAVTP